MSRSRGTRPPRLLTDAMRAGRWREAGCLALLLLGAFFANPDRPLPFDVCLWKRLTGWSCPTCGLTRSLCHALHGDWSGAVALHPAGPLALFVLVGWTTWAALEAWHGRRLWESKAMPPTLAVPAASGRVQ